MTDAGASVRQSRQETRQQRRKTKRAKTERTTTLQSEERNRRTLRGDFACSSPKKKTRGKKRMWSATCACQLERKGRVCFAETVPCWPRQFPLRRETRAAGSGTRSEHTHILENGQTRVDRGCKTGRRRREAQARTRGTENGKTTRTVCRRSAHAGKREKQ